MIGLGLSGGLGGDLLGRRRLVAASASSAASSNGLLTGLLSYWPLDEASGTRADSHGSSPFTEHLGVTSSASGISGLGANFSSGDSAYLICSSPVLSGQENTVNLWVNLVSQGVSGAFIGSASNEFLFGIKNANEIELIYNSFSSNDRTTEILAAGTLDSGMAMVTALYSSTRGLEIYVNAVLVSSEIPTGSWSSTNFIQRMGSSVRGLANGVFDECAAWDRALTPAEIVTLYNGGSGLFYPAFD